MYGKGYTSFKKPVTPPAGDTLTLSTTEQFFATTIPIGKENMIPGKAFGFNVAGVATILATLGLGFVVRIYLNSTVIASNSSINVALASQSGWDGSVKIHVISTGVSGKMEVQGGGKFVFATGSPVNFPLANASQVTIDTTQDQVLKMSLQVTGVSAGSTIQLRLVEAFGVMA